MKINLIIFISLVLLSCNNNEQKNVSTNDETEGPNLRMELVNSLDLSDQIKNILFVPDNSCKGCLQQTFKMCEELSKVNNLKVYYFNELELAESECAKNSDKIDFKIDYINYDIYGITLYELTKDSVSITYITPSNIDSIYTELLKN